MFSKLATSDCRGNGRFYISIENLIGRDNGNFFDFRETVQFMMDWPVSEKQ
jgi:hypothetical protein